jgi:UDP-glucose 6-dehydrogenase
LTEAKVYHDTRYPKRNIIGIPFETETYYNIAHIVMKLLPKAPFELITHSTNAELVKYAGNAFLLTKVVFANILHDLVKYYDGDWNEVHDAWIADPRIGHSHTEIFDKDGKRGAAGHCLLKDFEVFKDLFTHCYTLNEHDDFLTAIKVENLRYLIYSNKDLDIIDEVYGINMLDKALAIG